MSDRDRLIELILGCDKDNEVLDCFQERPKKRQSAEIIADYLLANGVIVPPNIGYKYAVLDAICALADMVAQFGYPTTFRKKEAVSDGGLSALENAFSALEYCGCRLNSNGTISLKNLYEFQEKIEKERENNGEIY